MENKNKVRKNMANAQKSVTEISKAYTVESEISVATPEPVTELSNAEVTEEPVETAYPEAEVKNPVEEPVAAETEISTAQLNADIEPEKPVKHGYGW